MKEPDVTLTDYALALECLAFCVLLWRTPSVRPALRGWWTFFFATVGIAAAIGGTVHGFLPDSRALWVATLLTLGATSLAAWMVGSHLLGVPWIRRMAAALLAIYCLAVLLVTQAFVVAIAMYLPATLFLLLVLIAEQRRAPARARRLGIIGLLLTFAAAAIQQLKLGVHPVYFNHNAVYHVIQFVALWLIFVAARDSVARS